MGSLHAAARKPGKVKGLERITTAFGKVAENYLPPSFIEVGLYLYIKNTNIHMFMPKVFHITNILQTPN